MSTQHKPNVELSCEPRLLAAALAGLLSLTACSTTESNPSGDGDTTTGGAASSGGHKSTGGTTSGGTSTGGATASGGASTGGGASLGGATSVGGTTMGGGTSVAGAAGAGGDSVPPHITSSVKIDNLDANGFKALCDARSGTVEIMPHCGGFATARGFSYDTTTSLLSEHTCAGSNTCAGWNCITND